jgi:hypothetical protein
MSELVSQNILQDKDNDFTKCRSRILLALTTKDHNLFTSALNSLLATVPYDDFSSAAKQKIEMTEEKMSVQEWLYRSVIIAFLRGCGVVTFAEVHSNLGRSDFILSHKGNIWVIEIKVSFDSKEKQKKATEAYQQIIDKNYAKPYPDAFCVGLAIDDKKREITEVVVGG